MTNSTANQGGAINVNQGSTLEVYDSVLRDIAAQRGGAIYNGRAAPPCSRTPK